MLVRLLMMFGPMLMRQFQKFQRQKQREQQTAPHENHQDYHEEPVEKKYTKDEFV